MESQVSTNGPELGAIKKVSPQGEFVIEAKAIVPHESATLTPVDLLRIAVSQGADIEKLKQLMDLQERWERNEARKAFDAALTKFKAAPPSISKNKHVKYPTRTGPAVDYWHATLDHVCDEVIPALSAVGLTHTWRIIQAADVITVVCVLKGYGHSEETQMQGPPDTSGDKSPLKAASSTVTYLERITLLAACGLAAKNEDNEMEGNGEPFIEAAEIEKACGEIAKASDIPTLKFLFGAALNKARELGDKKAMAHYITANDKRKKELEHAAR